jgi:hypothetical protein
LLWFGLAWYLLVKVLHEANNHDFHYSAYRTYFQRRAKQLLYCVFQESRESGTWLRRIAMKNEKVETVDFNLVLVERKLEKILRKKKENISESDDIEDRNAFNRSFECDLPCCIEKWLNGICMMVVWKNIMNL